MNIELFELDDLVKSGDIIPNMVNINNELAKYDVKVEILPDNSNIGKVALAIIDEYNLYRGEGFNEALDFLFHDGASIAYGNGILDEVLNNPIFN